MNREIKFRMWHEGKMEQPAFKLDTARLLEGMATNPDAPVIIGLDTLIPRMQERGVLMQYTGIKDKNGREIYEGDIVNHPHFFIPEMSSEWIKEDDTFEVKIPEFYAFVVDMKEGSNGQFMEVIGNIYENPELLKR